MQASSARGAVITGTGAALPDNIVTNAQLAATMDTSDEWIRSRTGIEERRIGGTTTSLSVEAGRKAIEDAGLEPKDIDLLLLATTTPDRRLPASAPGVAMQLGLNCGAADLNAVCSGWVYSLVAAHGMIMAGSNKILIIGAESLHTMIDWDDRSTAILFGDGAGAAVLEAVDGPGQMLAWHLAADGSLEKHLYTDHGDFVKMNGKEVFRNAVPLMVDSANTVLKEAGYKAEDVDLVIPHQANIRIIEACARRLDIPLDRWITILEKTGNTSAATVPMALNAAREQNRISDGDLVLMVGFGAGMTAASALVRWGGQ